MGDKYRYFSEGGVGEGDMGYWLYIDLSEESNSVVCKNNMVFPWWGNELPPQTQDTKFLGSKVK